MGTNFYLISKDEKWMRENFAVETESVIKNAEYESVDEPYLGYEVHLNKLSVGWRPLFQSHKNIKTFKKLEDFCVNNSRNIEIFDEYGKKYTWKQYYAKVYSHSQCQIKPFKWVYEINPIFKDSKPTLHIESCMEQEAEIHMPFCHREYDEKERKDQRRFHIYDRYRGDIKYWEDPDYSFDWTDGEFC